MKDVDARLIFFRIIGILFARRVKFMRKFFMYLLAALMGTVSLSYACDAFAAVEQEEIETEVFFRRAKEVSVPIVMYHLVTENPKYIGKYGVTPEELRQDLAYLKKKGYNTIVMQDLINYVERGIKLPKKPIMLTIDDGNYSDYSYLLPLLKELT